jgi:hypothetical protein
MPAGDNGHTTCTIPWLAPIDLHQSASYRRQCLIPFYLFPPHQGPLRQTDHSLAQPWLEMFLSSFPCPAWPAQSISLLCLRDFTLVFLNTDLLCDVTNRFGSLFLVSLHDTYSLRWSAHSYLFLAPCGRTKSLGAEGGVVVAGTVVVDPATTPTPRTRRVSSAADLLLACHPLRTDGHHLRGLFTPDPQYPLSRSPSSAFLLHLAHLSGSHHLVLRWPCHFLTQLTGKADRPRFQCINLVLKRLSPWRILKAR